MEKQLTTAIELDKVNKGEKSMRKKKDEDKQDHSFNLPTSDEIWVTEFNEAASQDFHDKVLAAFHEMPKRPIIINIDSYGGEVYALLSMIDTMNEIRESAPKEFFFVTVARGKAMSCGAELLVQGDLRVATPSSTIMIHRSSGGAGGHIKDMQIDLKEVERLDERLSQIFSDRIKYPGGVEKFKKLIDRDLYLTPDKALDLNVIDVVGYVKRKIELKHLIEIRETISPKPQKKAKKKQSAKKKPAAKKKKTAKKKEPDSPTVSESELVAALLTEEVD